MSRIAALFLISGLVTLIVHQWPEITRYLKMKRM
jgi:hypothetical protein